ncbi:MAG TPA: hypothetical protein VG893_07425 [Terracidiphilus sp.]|nr:hypothetical protein [Terracidiphilus sp.]
MRWLLLIPVCVIALAVPVVVLAGGGSGFDGVVSAIETRYNTHATRIPFLGLVSLVAHKATNGGVGNLHVAEFDNFTAPVDGDELNRMVESKLGAGWERVIRETSRKGGEQTLVFMRPEGSRMGLFVLDLDGSEMDVVQASVDPDHLNENIARYSHYAEHTEGEGSSD